jgi:hypothetical protein
MAYDSDAVNAIVNGTSDASAVQRSSAGFKAPGQTAFAYTGTFFSLVASGSSMTTQVVGSLATTNPTTGLPANVYITDFAASTNFANTSGNMDTQVQVGGVAMLRGSMHNLVPIDFINMETQPTTVAGGKAISIVIGSVVSTTQTWYFLAGWSE